MSFPNVPAALEELIPGGQVWLQTDYLANLPVHEIVDLGGQESFPFRTDRMRVTTYGSGGSLNDTRDLAEELKEFLTSRPHETTFGLIDEIECSVTPRLSSMTTEQAVVFETTYLIRTRAT